MKIIQASFFWKNDKPGGIGVTFGPMSFIPHELQEMFAGKAFKDYTRDSDKALGTNVVNDYLDQLTAIGRAKQEGTQITMQQSILAALNIMWLTDRGFMPQDEFNGYQFIKAI